MEQREESSEGSSSTEGSEGSARTEVSAQPEGSEPLAETVVVAADISRAAAEAAAEAAAGAESGDELDRGAETGPGHDGPGHDGPGHDGPGYDGPTHDVPSYHGPGYEDYPSPDDGAAARGPRRWLVTIGVAVSALALAGTAVAIASRSSHGSSGDTTENTAVGRTADSSPTLSESSQSSQTTGTTTQTSSSTSQSSSSSSSSSSPTKPSTSSKSSSSKSSSPAPPAGTDEVDCENSSHNTAQDDALKFSGMTKGTQSAFLAAQAAAKADGLSFILNSGYRSAAYQQRIFDCWVNELGSAKAARTYALPPSESAHVKGYAMDIAPPSAASWLEDTDGKYGLCRRYADETWHFEYQATYKTKGCPALLPHP